jgi:hypothetical protein
MDREPVPAPARNDHRAELGKPASPVGPDIAQTFEGALAALLNNASERRNLSIAVRRWSGLSLSQR